MPLLKEKDYGTPKPKTDKKVTVEIDGFTVDLSAVQTNIVMVDIEHMTSGELLEKLKSRGVLAGPASETQVRFVTHRDVGGEDIETAVGRLKELAK